MTGKQKQVRLPEWTNSLPDHTNLTALDLLQFFDYKRTSCVSHAALKGLIPPPTFRKNRSSGSNIFKPKLFWKLGDLRKLYKEQQEALRLNTEGCELERSESEQSR